MVEVTDLAIIGGGPAGFTAAKEAMAYDVKITIIDNCPQLGGQYHKQIPAEFKYQQNENHKKTQLFDPLHSSNLTILNDAVVWAINPQPEQDQFLLSIGGEAGTPRRLIAKRVIVSPGAYDRPFPFPGWDLPGVMTAGAAQILIKNQRILPGQRFLLAGTGPLQWSLAHLLISGGARVVSIVDANPFPWKALGKLPSFWGQWERSSEGVKYWSSIITSGVPIHFNHSIYRVEGNEAVERAIIGPASGGANKSIDVDTICLSYGFTPSSQLSIISGAEHYYSPVFGGYIPVRKESLETTIPGLFAVGDSTGTGGKDVAIAEGRLAVLGALSQLKINIHADAIAEIRKQLNRQRKFAQILQELFPYPAELLNKMPADTVICRCEQVTLGDLRAAMQYGFNDQDNLKTLTRIGMGRCQGRMCKATLDQMINPLTQEQSPGKEKLKSRPPAIPITIESLLEEGVGHVS